MENPQDKIQTSLLVNVWLLAAMLLRAGLEAPLKLAGALNVQRERKDGEGRGEESPMAGGGSESVSQSRIED